MRWLRSLVVVVGLCLCLAPSVASAAEAPSTAAGSEAGGITRILSRLEELLKAAWENDACQIDPLGRCAPGTGTTDPAPGTDEAGEIDPWG
jgi:hypothetical protein